MTTTTIYLPGDQPTQPADHFAGARKVITRHIVLEAGDEGAAKVLRRELDRIRREYSDQHAEQPASTFQSSI